MISANEGAQQGGGLSWICTIMQGSYRTAAVTRGYRNLTRTPLFRAIAIILAEAFLQKIGNALRGGLAVFILSLLPTNY